MKISVIVPTYNGAKKIGRLLNTIGKQTRLPDEVIIVVDGSTDDTEKVLSQNEFKSLNLNVLIRPNSGRAVSRNKGVEIATGDIFIFYDDDMEPAENSIEKYEQLAIQTNQVCLIGGNSVEFYSEAKTDIQNYKSFLSMKWTEKYQATITTLDRSNLFFSTATCAISKEAFSKLHGFDPQLTDAEDFDLALRALNVEMLVLFDKSNQAIHHDAITCKSYIKRKREYHTAHEQLAKKYATDDQYKVVHRASLKRAIYRLFAFPFLVRLIDSNKLNFLPKKIRYKLYDVVIHSLSNEYPEIEL